MIFRRKVKSYNTSPDFCVKVSSDIAIETLFISFSGVSEKDYRRRAVRLGPSGFENPMTPCAFDIGLNKSSLYISCGSIQPHTQAEERPLIIHSTLGLDLQVNSLTHN